MSNNTVELRRRIGGGTIAQNKMTTTKTTTTTDENGIKNVENIFRRNSNEDDEKPKVQNIKQKSLTEEELLFYLTSDLQNVSSRQATKTEKQMLPQTVPELVGNLTPNTTTTTTTGKTATVMSSTIDNSIQMTTTPKRIANNSANVDLDFINADSINNSKQIAEVKVNVEVEKMPKMWQNQNDETKTSIKSNNLDSSQHDGVKIIRKPHENYADWQQTSTQQCDEDERQLSDVDSSSRPRRSSVVRRRSKFISDTIDVAIRVGIVALFCKLETMSSFKRKIQLEELWLYKYPRNPDIVSPLALLGAVIFSPLLVTLFHLVLTRNFRDFRAASWSWTLAICLNGLATSLLKISVGRPRPDFFYRCFPDGVLVLNDDYPNNYNGVDLLNCTGDPRAINEGYKSFPSGHSSFAFVAASFLTFYVGAKLHAFNPSGRGQSWRLFISIFPLFLATLVAISRTCDYHHHWQDVLIGSLIGIFVAYFAYRQYYPSIFSLYCDRAYYRGNIGGFSLESRRPNHYHYQRQHLHPNQRQHQHLHHYQHHNQMFNDDTEFIESRNYAGDEFLLTNERASERKPLIANDCGIIGSVGGGCGNGVGVGASDAGCNNNRRH